MSQNVNLRLSKELLEDEFPRIEFRNTAIGRQPFVKDSGMAVWEFIMVAKAFDSNSERTADYLRTHVDSVKAALKYYETFREEIDRSLAENNVGEERLRQMFPHLRTISLPGSIMFVGTDS